MKLKIIAIVTICTMALGAAAAPARPSDIVLDWNESLLALAEAEDGFLTLKGLRTAAMAHLAMYDALSSIHETVPRYRYGQSTPQADPLSAVAQAAFVVGSEQFPDHVEKLAHRRDEWLARVADAKARAAGVALGEEVARLVLRDRAGDGWDSQAEYKWHPMGPGVYAEFAQHSDTPEGFIFGAGWARARGFALSAQDQFRAPPPPAINSDEYTRAFNEVKRVGRFQTLDRTPDQTHMALWWKDFAENSHNRLARDLVAKENLGLIDTARLFALLNASIFDAYVGVFDNKFFYNHWRPYTAIRWAAHDGNPATKPEEDWTNTHRHTYAFPSYPSAHGTACAAAMTVMADVFGDDYAFVMRTPRVDVGGPLSGKIDMHPATRRFDSFEEAAEECALSRLYLGIHFRYDSTAGVALGRLIGRNVLDNLLTCPRHPPHDVANVVGDQQRAVVCERHADGTP